MRELLHFWFWVCLTGLLSCSFEKTAGTSTGTENPEITLAFTVDSGDGLVTGKVAVYGNTQVPFIDPEPVIEYDLMDVSEFTLPLSGLNSHGLLPAVLNKRITGSDIHFNVVVVTKGKANLSADFSMNEETGSIRRNGDLVNKAFETKLRSLRDAEFYLDWDVSSEEPAFLFIPGSPYYLELTSRDVIWPQIPQGQHTVYVVSDKGNVFSLHYKLEPGFTEVMRVQGFWGPLHDWLSLLKSGCNEISGR